MPARTQHDRRQPLDPGLVQLLTDVGTYICGQQRCVVVEGFALPVCQRCFGVYLGAALTGASLLAGNVSRHPLPARPIVGLHAALLVVALLSGLHVIDYGPTWRLLCGLWTGHVAVVWLVGGARQVSAARIDPAPGWSRPSSLVLTAAPLALILIAWAISAWGQTGWYLWTGIIVLGMLALAFSTALALAAIGRWLMRGLRRRAPRGGSAILS